MDRRRRAGAAPVVCVFLVLALGLAAGGDAIAAGQQREAERMAAPRAMAGPEAGRAAEAESSKNKTLLTVAIIGGIAAAVLVAILLLKKKPKPETTTTTTTAPPETGSIQVGSTPAGARVYLDGTDTGRTTPTLLTGVLAGSRTVKLALDRYQDWSASVTVSRDQTAAVSTTLQAGDFRESFDGGTAPFWQPVTGSWTAAGGAYSVTAAPPVNFAASQYTLGDYGDFTMEVRGQVFRPNGGSGRAHGIVFRGTGNLSKFYIFQVNPGGASPLWDVFEITNDQVTRQYDPWQPTTAIHEGWNTIKIVAQGSTFTFYANGQLLGSRTIPEAPARGRVGLGVEVDANGSDAQFDDVVLSGSSAFAKSNGVSWGSQGSPKS